jgi:homoserine dehydrogenase
MLSIEGILSGTLSVIFNSFKPGMVFNEVGCRIIIEA